jgi:uncharacterized protein YndB with AHSA1/START domain
MELSFREEFGAPLEKVFSAVTDIPAAEKWMPNLVRMELLTEGAYGVGTRWRETRKMFGKEAAEVFEVVAYTPGKHIELFVDGKQGASGRGEYRFKYDFEERGGKTVVSIHGSITGMGCMGVVFGWMFKGMFAKAIRKDHEALRQYIESL